MILIILVLLYIFGMLACMYAFEDAFVFELPTQYQLRQPTLSDLRLLEDNSEKEYLQSEYVKKEICPAHYYFALLCELKSNYSKHQNGAFLSYSIVAVCPFLLFVRYLSNLHCLSIQLLNWIVAVAVWIVGYFLACFIYRKCFPLEVFPYQKEDFSMDSYLFRNVGAKYNETMEAARNNFVIEMHLHYLQSIKDTVIFRSAVARILNFIAGAIYLFFFFSPEM